MAQTKYDKQFKLDAVTYMNNHPGKTYEEYARELDVPKGNLPRWKKEMGNAPTEDAVFRGTGNYANEAEKEAARLRKENKDLKDALEILKKAISILGK